MNQLKHVHILGIGGCACSAIGEYLCEKGVRVTGSERAERDDLNHLEQKGIKIFYRHAAENLSDTPDLLLYSPAVKALAPDNPEFLEAQKLGIPQESWETFIGKYLLEEGRTGITVSGSEGKGTTAGILTAILQDTKWAPLSILGAQMKTPFGDSNIFMGKGSTYILEGDEYNRNFHNYHPQINIMINFAFEHPETYRDFADYKASFAHFFNGMTGQKKQILHATPNIIEFVRENNFTNITWFGFPEETALLEKSDVDKTKVWTITNHKLSPDGNHFTLESTDETPLNLFVPALPGYLALNATGAVLAALELGMTHDDAAKGLKRFMGMKRRFDVCGKKPVFITDYGHSPESIRHIISEIRNIYPQRKLHLIFQPHLFSRTFNFLDDFASALAAADKVSLIDIYPAREKKEEWAARVSSEMLAEKTIQLNPNTEYCGSPQKIAENLKDKIDVNDVVCLMGAGDMDRYYGKLIGYFNKD